MIANYPTLSPRLRAMAARMARQAGIEISDAHQQLELIAIEFAGDFDAGRGASRETYYIKKLDAWIKQQRAGMRFGVALDDEEVSDAAEAEAAAAIAGIRSGGVAEWRVRSDEEAAERIAVLPEHLRKFAQRVALGATCQEAAVDLGLTDRRARQAVAEIVAFFTVCTTGAQPSLF